MRAPGTTIGRALALLLLAPLATGASKPRLVPDVSQSRIDIRYSFTGAELLLFGAILYPGGRVPSEDADIAVVVKGPLQPLVLREKQKVAGIWMNVESARFRSAPSFYAVASSRPLASLVDERMAAIYELGVQNLQLSPGSGLAPEVQRRFENGLIDMMQRKQLYYEDPRGVKITDGVLYRARIRIPARVPVGNYTAETFLIKDGRVLAGAVRDIRVEKLGFERFIADAANRWSLAYGLVAVGLSLLLGWGASALFRRGLGRFLPPHRQMGRGTTEGGGGVECAASADPQREPKPSQLPLHHLRWSPSPPLRVREAGSPPHED